MRPSMMIPAAIAAWLAGAPAGLACEGKVIYEDSFDRLEPTWGGEDDGFYVEDGVLYLEPDPEQGYYGLNNFSYYYDAADICVTVTPTDIGKETDSEAGLMFWGVDVDNYYGFMVRPDGQASVFRRQKGKTLTQVGVTKFDAIKKGENATNELRVLIKDKSATLYINGKKFKQINGNPPADGWLAGVRAGASHNDILTFAFDDFVVTDVPAVAKRQ